MARARGLHWDIDLIGDVDTVQDLADVANRMTHLAPAFQKVVPILEAGEQRLFDRAKGKYVDSGDLKRSLTQPNANGAIRQAHKDELEFGTSIFYAVWQRKAKKSAVLQLQPKAKKQASEVILNYVSRGH